MLYYIKLWDNLSIDSQCIQHLSVVSVTFNGKLIKYNDTVDKILCKSMRECARTSYTGIMLMVASFPFKLIWFWVPTAWSSAAVVLLVLFILSHQGNAITLGTITSDDTHTSESNKMNTNFSNAFSTTRHRNGKASILRRLKVFFYFKKKDETFAKTYYLEIVDEFRSL